LISDDNIIEKYNNLNKILNQYNLNMINLVHFITKKFISFNKIKKIYNNDDFCHILINLYKLQKIFYTDFNWDIQIHFFIVIFLKI
jgi:hypothetical protein